MRAFPLPYTSTREDTSGMTLRAYFMAHAPAQPQPWFQPEVYKRPDLPDKFAALGQEQRRELSDHDNDGLNAEDASEPVRLFIAERAKARAKLAAWEKFRDKARYVQWPVAWADAMIAEMERQA